MSTVFGSEEARIATAIDSLPPDLKQLAEALDGEEFGTLPKGEILIVILCLAAIRTSDGPVPMNGDEEVSRVCMEC